jgi:predicted kinase
MDRLAHRLVAFHAAAPSGPDVATHAAPERLVAGWHDVLDGVSGFVPRLLAAEDLEILSDFGPRFVHTHETLLRARQAGGRVREGHGDLHAEHVCVLERPGDDPAGALTPGIYVFDCIEFSRPLRCTDVAAEIAFLSMDLERRSHRALGDRFARAYAAAANDPDVLLLLPFYVCVRACIRGKVEGLKAGEAEVDPAEREEARAHARAFFALALRYAWRAAGPAVVACAGLSGSGKSTLAQALAEATGLTVVSSDVLRKGGRGGTAGAVAPYGAGRYTPEARGATYAALCAEADAELTAGRGVIADATWMRRADRDRLAAVARAHRRPLLFVECVAGESTIRSRLETRAQGPSLSDARWDTYVAQRREWEPLGDDEPRVIVDTGGGTSAARAAALRALWRWIHGNRSTVADQR